MSVFVCQHNNCRTVSDIVMKFLWEQDMVKERTDEFKTGCIPMHCGARVVSDITSVMF